MNKLFLIIYILMIWAVVLPAQSYIMKNTPYYDCNTEVKASEQIDLKEGFSFQALSNCYTVLKIDKTLVQTQEYKNTSYQQAMSDFETREIDKTKAIGSTSGGAAVNASGSATYSIPIWTAPGTAGMVPSVSIGYNSQQGNGLLGYGWSLNAGSSIRRVAQTQYYDGVEGIVSFTSGDKFSLDGGRLILISGNNGEDGSVYHTSIETFSKIILHKEASGIMSFEVQTKSGNTFFYGTTADSRMLAGGTAHTLEWLLKKEVDDIGNYIEYSYTQMDGSYRLSKISYTGLEQNGTQVMAPYNSIEFEYGDRADKQRYYLNGTYQDDKLLLKKIIVSSENTIMRTYTLNYTYTDATLYSRLYEIVETLSDGSQYNSTLIKWGEESEISDHEVELKDDNKILSYDNMWVQFQTCNLNNDGVDDIIELNDESMGPIHRDDSYTGDDFGQIINRSSISTSFSFPIVNGIAIDDGVDFYGKKTIMVDLNGDHLDDAFALRPLWKEVENSGITRMVFEVWINQGGKGFKLEKTYSSTINFTQTETTREIGQNGRYVQVSDAYDTYDIIPYSKGGGLTGVLVLSRSKDDPCFYYDYSLPNVQLISNRPPILDNKHRIIPGDFNGNGVTDFIILTTTNGTRDVIEVADNAFISRFYTTASLSSNDKVQTGDFNGDGLTDIFHEVKTGVTYQRFIYYSIGNGFNTQSISLIRQSHQVSDMYHVIDLNGDGLSDIVDIFDEYKSAYCVANKKNMHCHANFYLNNGTGFNRIYLENIYVQPSETLCTDTENNIFYESYLPRMPFGDFNGDGVLDLFISNQTGIKTFNSFIKHFNFPQMSLKVTDILNGLNQKISFTYLPMSNTTVYTPSAQKPVFPISTYRSSQLLPRTLVQPNGIGAYQTSYYKYNGMRMHALAGYLGFTSFSVLNPDNTKDEQVYEILQSNGTVSVALKSSEHILGTGTNVISRTMFTNILLPYQHKGHYFKYVDQVRQINFIQGAEKQIKYIYNPTDILNGNLTSKTTKSLVANARNTISEVKEEYSYTHLSAVTWCPAHILEATTTTTHADDPGKSFINKTTFDYYLTSGLLKSKTDYANKTKTVLTKYTYYPQFNALESVTVSVPGSEDIAPTTTSYAYDSKYRFVIKTTNPLDMVTRQSYNPRTGQVYATTDINNLTTTYSYDSKGVLRSVTDPLGITTTYSQNWCSMPGENNEYIYSESIVQLKTGNVSSRTYHDAFGRAVRTAGQTFNGQTLNTMYQNTLYDAFGRVSKASEPYLTEGGSYRTSEITYDDYHRVKTQKDITGKTVSYSYQKSGDDYKTTVSTANMSSSQTVNAAGQIISAQDDGGSITYKYNSTGQIKEISTPLKTILMSYDDYGRQKTLNDPSAGLVSYEYNDLGQVSSQTDAQGNVTENITYDVLGRIIQKTLRTASSNQICTYAYTYDTINAYGKPASVRIIDKGKTTYYRYAYDQYSRLITFTENIDGKDYITRYTYTNDGQVASVVYPSTGYTISYKYMYGELAEVLDAKSNQRIWKLTEKTPTLYKSEQGNGLITQKQFDTNYQLSAIKTGTTASNANILNFGYTYYTETGNMQTRQDHNRNLTETFVYDPLDRLTDITLHNATNNSTNTFTARYEDNGNIKQKSNLAQTISYNGTQPDAVQKLEQVQTNMSQQQIITYTPFNKVRTITEPQDAPLQNTEIDFTYGPNNERVRVKSTKEGEESYMYYASNYEKCITKGYDRELHYISAGDGITAIYVRFKNRSTQQLSDSMYYIHTDHMGSIVAITDQNKAIIEQRSYDAWGKPRNPSTWQTSENVVFKVTARGYTLHEHIALFDIINMNGRLYDAKLGRMLSPDNYIQAPTSTQSYNRYSYAFNNPLKYVDPDGNWAISGYTPSTSSMGKGADSYWNIMKVIAEHDAYQAEINRTNERIAYEANRRGWESLFAQIETAIENGGSSLGISMDVLKLTDVSPYGAGIGGFLADPKGNYTSIITTKTEGQGLIVPKSFDISGWFGDGEPQGGGVNDYPGGSYLRSSDVLVTFDGNANNMVNPSLSGYFGTIMTKASAQGINSVNISSTTVHPSNASRSAHTIANGARGLDINYINGVHVSTNNPYVSTLQNIIKSTPGYLENYGPLIINKVNNGSVIEAPWARDIKGGHYDHIHLSVPRH